MMEDNTGQGEVIEPTYFEPRVKSKPRQKDHVYIPPKLKKEKSPWNFNTSIFKDYQKDTEELLDRCFEFDYKCSRIHTLFDKSKEKEVKAVLRKFYLKMKNTYKYYSALTVSDIWCVGRNNFTDLCVNQMKIVDGNFSSAEMDIEWEVIHHFHAY